MFPNPMHTNRPNASYSNFCNNSNWAGNRGRKISASRQLKYLDLLNMPLEFLNKPTARLTVADVERFEQALSTGGVLSRGGCGRRRGERGRRHWRCSLTWAG
jgi:hypothetical protein